MLKYKMYQYWHLLVFLRAFPNALTFDQEGIISFKKKVYENILFYIL
jgi:hypothetical protein